MTSPDSASCSTRAGIGSRVLAGVVASPVTTAPSSVLRGVGRCDDRRTSTAGRAPGSRRAARSRPWPSSPPGGACRPRLSGSGAGPVRSMTSSPSAGAAGRRSSRSSSARVRSGTWWTGVPVSTRTPKPASRTRRGSARKLVTPATSGAAARNPSQPPPERMRLGALGGERRAVEDVDDAAGSEEQRGPADRVAAGGRVVLGVAQDPPGGRGEQEGGRPGEPAHQADDDVVDDRGHRAVEVPPDRRGGQQGAADGEQADAVAPQRGVEVAGAVTDPPHRPADEVGEPEPETAQPAADRADQQRQRSGTAGAGGVARRGGAARLGLGARGAGARRGSRRARGRTGRARSSGRPSGRSSACGRRGPAGRAGGRAAGHPTRLSVRPTHPRDLSRPIPHAPPAPHVIRSSALSARNGDLA